jgi:hypothetical protein
MKHEEFQAYLKKRGFSENVKRRSIEAVEGFEGWLEGQAKALEGVPVAEIGAYVRHLMDERQNTQWRIVALARYFYITGNKPGYIYLVSVINARGILPELEKRVALIAGEEARAKVFKGVEELPLGTPPKGWPALTKRVVERLEELPRETCRKALAGNLHRVPASAFKEQKALFKKCKGIDEYLEKVHARAVAELEEHSKSGRLWYEQEITPEVVELVRGNQEMLAGMRHGGKIYMTKIPYAPKDWLVERSPVRKRYLACHCPLARESILSGKDRVPGTWCYCSAGFEKFPLEVVLGQGLKVEVLESVLSGGDRCRFAITMPVKCRKAQ